MKKFLGIIVAVSLSVIAAGGLILLIVVGMKLETPGNLTVYASGEKKYLQSTVSDSAKGYIWNIKEEGGTEFTVTTSGNIFDVSGYVKSDIKYFFKVAYKAEIQNANSNFSEVKEYTFIQAVETVQIFQRPHENIVYWESLLSATKYRVYVRSEKGTESFDTTGLQFDYSTLNGGVYAVYVRAINASGKLSKISNVIGLSVRNRNPVPEYISFDNDSCVLVLNSEKEIRGIDIVYVGVEYSFMLGGGSMNISENIDGTYKIEINLKNIYTGNSEIFYRAAADGNFDESSYNSVTLA